MSDPSTSDRVGRARTFLSQLGTTDFGNVRDLLDENVSYHVLGTHALAGSFTGPEAVATHLKEIIAQTAGRFHPVKWEDWLLGLENVAALVDIHIEVDGATQTVQHLILVHFTVNDSIDRITVFFADPDAVARLYGPK